MRSKILNNLKANGWDRLARKIEMSEAERKIIALAMSKARVETDFT